MREASVNLVTVGVFAWAFLEPEPGRHDFTWLDDILDKLAAADIAVDLATATASPPAWLARTAPETLPMMIDGTVMWPGSRQAYCPSSPVYRQHAVDLATRMAERYGDHPALVMWHVGNEYGCHNARCYCDVSAGAFRRWLQTRYGDLTSLNEAWGTAFWSQRYADWEEIWPPRTAPAFHNPTQVLDFRRFSSDELRDCYRAERQVLDQITPHVPVTTNFMVTRFEQDVDYWSWANEVDIVSNDHYLDAADADAHIELAFSADLTRGLSGGEPWLLMEHSTSAINWQPRNVSKQPGELTRNSFTHIARGSQGALYFQWRASRAGAEKFHSALVPHAGTDTKIWREVKALGASLRNMNELAKSRVHADVGMIFDWQSWWATQLDGRPSVDLAYRDVAESLYRPLWNAGISVDMVSPGGNLSGYRLIVVPMLYVADDAASAAIHEFVQDGGHVLITYYSGIVDRNDHVGLGGYPAAFRELLGIRAEEFFPLPLGTTVQLDDGSVADTWTELLHLDGATCVAAYRNGPVPGTPAITFHRYGEGTAWYMATNLQRSALDRLMRRITAEAGVQSDIALPPGVETVRRTSERKSWLFVINHTSSSVTVNTKGHELISGHSADEFTIDAGSVAVVRESV